MNPTRLIQLLPATAPGFVALLAVVCAHLLLTPAGHYRADLLLGLLAFAIAYLMITGGPLMAAGGMAMSTLVLVDSVDGDIRYLFADIAAVSLSTVAGSVFGLAVTHEQETAARFQDLIQRRIQRLQGSPGYWQTVAATRNGLYVTRVEATFIQEALAKEAPGVVADIGAGSGRLEFAIAPHARTVIATEVDTQELANMERDYRVIPVAVGAFPSLPFRDHSLDAVVAIEAPAVSDQSWFLEECRRTLKPGATAIIMAYNASSYKGLVSRLLRRHRAERGQRWADLYYQYSLGENLRRWREAGFTEIRKVGFYWSPVGRSSDSPLVPVIATMERVLGLQRLTAFSPWVMLELRNDQDAAATV